MKQMMRFLFTQKHGMTLNEVGLGWYMLLHAIITALLVKIILSI